MSHRSAFTHAGALILALTLVLQASSNYAAASWLWSSSVAFTNTVASTPVLGGGYSVEPVTNAYLPGKCGPQPLNSNHSESWIAVKPGTEDLIGNSKFFVSKWSTFYDFHLGTYTILGGTPVANNQVQGYDCTTVGTQDMPPSWTMNTDPNVDFDTRGRAYQVTLPFNAYWQNLHPNAAVMASYSDDMGRHWVTANDRQPLEQSPNSSSLQYGHVEDKQWVAVNHIPGHPYQDHVYALWSVFNGAPSGGSVDLRLAVSVGRAGHLYMTYEDWDAATGQFDVKFVQSTDAGANWSAPVKVNDNAEPNASGYTDQFQPSIAAGPNGAVAIAFYDRRAACPNHNS